MYSIELNQFMLDNLDGMAREEYQKSNISRETLHKFFPEAFTNFIDDMTHPMNHTIEIETLFEVDLVRQMIEEITKSPYELCTQ